MTLSFRTASYSLSHGSTVVCAVARTCLDTRVADFLSGILAGEAATERALLISSLGLKPADGLQEIGRASHNLGYVAILSASINTSFSCCHSIRQTSHFPLAVVLLLFALSCAVGSYRDDRKHPGWEVNSQSLLSCKAGMRWGHCRP